MSIQNISLAYPKLDKNAARQLAYENFTNIGTTVAETIIMASGRFDFDDAIVNKVEFQKQTQAMLKKNKKGVIFIAAHFGNWEFLPQYFAKTYFPLVVIGREGNNTLIEQNITTPFRERFGSKNIYKNGAIAGIIKALKNKEIIGILLDQKAGQNNSTKTTFFGRECYTNTSVAMLKLKYDPMIVPVFAMRESLGKFKIILGNEVEYVASEAEKRADKINFITQKYNNILEEVIRQAPNQWFWMHNRWKIS